MAYNYVRLQVKNREKNILARTIYCVCWNWFIIKYGLSILLFPRFYGVMIVVDIIVTVTTSISDDKNDCCFILKKILLSFMMQNCSKNNCFRYCCKYISPYSIWWLFIQWKKLKNTLFIIRFRVKQTTVKLTSFPQSLNSVY